MKNLEVLTVETIYCHQPVTEAKHLAQSPDTRLYFIRNRNLCKFEFTPYNTTTAVCPLTFDNVICIKILSFESKICVVCANLIHVFSVENDDFICSIELESDIKAISWSPTEENAVTVSHNGDVSTCSFDYVSGTVIVQGKSSVSSDIPGTVYVGWGSKETQFRGSEGKLKRDEKPVEVELIMDKTPVISWRGNGEMFAVNYYVDGVRKFVVFETPCKALYRSEGCPGLQPVIAWRPAGNMIATVTEIGEEKSVVIWEKNGEKRFEFVLDFEGVKIKDLKWSPCARILAVHCVSSSNPNEESLRLMTCSNYKWYEKQNLTFTTENPLFGFEWLDTTHFTYQLQVLVNDAAIRYTFRNVIHRHGATVAVINGRKLQLTDFSEAVIPPSLYCQEIDAGASINFVAMNRSRVAIVTSDNRVKVFNLGKLNLDNKLDWSERLNFERPLETASYPFQFRDFVIKNESNMVFYCNDDGMRQYVDESGVQNSLSYSSLFDHEYNRKYNMSLGIGDCMFWHQCKGRGGSEDSSDVKDCVFWHQDDSHRFNLKVTGRFYVDDTEVSDAVNSFVVTDRYVLFTTKLNVLYCTRFARNLELDLNKMYKRCIEQGAEIVAAIPNSPQVVLQMPRGNLETISIRLISIDILDALLNENQWAEALFLMRTEKLNANLLVDLNPQRFIDNIGPLIEACKSVNELNNIFLEIEERNVLRTMYENCAVGLDLLTVQSKVEQVFTSVLNYFDSVKYEPYITSIMIITYHHFTLNKALTYVLDLLKQNLEKPAAAAISTLKTYGCDDQKLYVESLLLYDFDLAHLVVKCCQLDPRVYVPQLTALSQLNTTRARFEINVLAKKPEVAVAYLLADREATSAQIEEFIEDNRVAEAAYDACQKTNGHYRIVARVYARSLSRKGHHFEAGVVLKRADVLDEALIEYKLAHRWRECLDLMEELGVEGDARLSFVKDLAHGLVQRRKIADAAWLYESYAGDSKQALRILLDNCFFEEAVRVAQRHKMKDEFEQLEIVTALFKQYQYLKMMLGELKDVFEKHKARLSEVRKTKAARFNDYDGDDGHDDLFSDAGSVTTKSSRSSSRSRSSTASSKNRRKEERKKSDLRPGGAYEDIALMKALHGNIHQIYRKSDDVTSLCELLMQESDMKFRDVRILHDLYKQLLDDINRSTAEIWPAHFYSHDVTRDVQQLADLQNFDQLDMQYRTPPVCPFNTWGMDIFKSARS